jgi:hypothetical protein
MEEVQPSKEAEQMQQVSSLVQDTQVQTQVDRNRINRSQKKKSTESRMGMQGKMESKVSGCVSHGFLAISVLLKKIFGFLPGAVRPLEENPVRFLNDYRLSLEKSLE